MSQPLTLSGTGPLSGDEAAAALAALGWLVDAGVATLVGNEPATWLAEAPQRGSVVAPLLSTSSQRSEAPAKATAVTGVAAIAARAAGAETLEALALLVAEASAKHGGGQISLIADGNPASRVMVLGDMPSADDLAAGKLFAGAAGALLDRMLAAIGRDRADTYLSNLLAWPLPGGRTPNAHEIAAQLPFVRRRIELVRPRAVLVLGGIAAAGLLGVDHGIGRLRGRWQKLDLAPTLDFGTLSVPVMPSFAPAYLFAHPSHKALAWRDLLLFKSALAAYSDAS